MRFLSGLLIFMFSILPLHGKAEGVNAGFVQGLWYATPTIFAGEPTRIYVALRNHTDQDLTGTVRFTDNGKRIGVSYVSALPGRLVEAWVDWTPTFGEHTVAASLSEIRLHSIGESPETAEVVSMLAEDTLTIDYDTDKDGVGNEIDTDDDNDGVSDVDEKARGSNPLVPNPTQQDTESDEKITSDIERVSAPEKDQPSVREPNEERGLEQYVDEGTVDTLLENATGKIERAKVSLDTYREKRNEVLYSSSTDTNELGDSSALSSNIDNATITRSRIEPQDGFVSAFVAGVKTLLDAVWTFILWVISKALMHPAILELLLLIGILYGLYRTARRFGRRQY